MSNQQWSLVAGVDEAGRGAVLGPLVVAGVLLDRAGLTELGSVGVKDSKLLTPRRREALAEEIERVAEAICVVEIRPVDIDQAVLHGHRLRRLNYIEMEAMARILAELRPDVAYIDACDVNTQRCAATVSSFLQSSTDIVASHHADRDIPAVSAASIIAKVRRDARIEELGSIYGKMGSGYPSDKTTMLFLGKLLQDTGEPPWFVRKSWKTIARLKVGSQAPAF